MNALKNILLAVLLVTTIVASALAWKQYQELAQFRAQSVSANERADLQKRIWDAQKRAEQAEARAATAGPADPGARPEEAGGENAQTRMIGSLVDSWVGMMNDPDAQRLMAAQQKAAISSRFAELFKKLNLPPDKLEKFKAELLDMQTSRNDAVLAAAQQGINPIQNPQEFRRLEESIQADINHQMRTTLGDASYDEYQNFQASAGQRAVVSQLESSLSYTDAPLAPAQKAQVAEILANTGPAHADGTPPNKNNSRVTDATVAAASSGVLAPRQVQALQEIQQQQQANDQLQKMMRQNRGPGQMGPPGMPKG